MNSGVSLLDEILISIVLMTKKLSFAFFFCSIYVVHYISFWIHKPFIGVERLQTNLAIALMMTDYYSITMIYPIKRLSNATNKIFFTTVDKFLLVLIWAHEIFVPLDLLKWIVCHILSKQLTRITREPIMGKRM